MADSSNPSKLTPSSLPNPDRIILLQRLCNVVLGCHSKLCPLQALKLYFRCNNFVTSPGLSWITSAEVLMANTEILSQNYQIIPLYRDIRIHSCTSRSVLGQSRLCFLATSFNKSFKLQRDSMTFTFRDRPVPVFFLLKFRSRYRMGGPSPFSFTWYLQRLLSFLCYSSWPTTSLTLTPMLALSSTVGGWTQSLQSQQGHLFWTWNNSALHDSCSPIAYATSTYPFTAQELGKLYFHLFHPSSKKLYNVILWAQPHPWSTKLTLFRKKYLTLMLSVLSSPLTQRST